VLPAAVVLSLLTLALAWPVPILLARARWTARAPGTALALWQAIALAGGLSMIGALLTYGLIPFGPTLGRGLVALAQAVVDTRLPAGTGFEHVFAVCGAVLLGTHLLLNLIATVIRSERQRRRHLTLVELLSQPYPELGGTRVIDHAAPVAYCLPGATRSITVLSAGLLDLLAPGELRAVIAHEKAHLRQQHHTVLLAFKSWHSALPWFPIANRAENAVALLVEMLADDQARRVAGDDTVVRAIVRVATAMDGHGEPATDADFASPTSTHADEVVTLRVRRLLTHTSPMPAAARAGVLAVATALLAVPTALLLVS
jgi:Zn-dependent protease with chaperone function